MFFPQWVDDSRCHGLKASVRHTGGAAEFTGGECHDVMDWLLQTLGSSSTTDEECEATSDMGGGTDIPRGESSSSSKPSPNGNLHAVVDMGR